MEPNLTKLLKEFMDDYPFYAHFLMNSRRVISDKVPTAGVCLKHNTIYFYFNPTWFFSKSIEFQKGVIKHEILHLVGIHLNHALSKENSKLVNIAGDIAINQYIREFNDLRNSQKNVKKEDIKDGALFPETFGFPENLTMEKYYDLLKQEMDKNKKDGNFDEFSTLDDHDIWSESEGSKEFQEEIIKKIAKEAMKKAGNTTGNKNIDDIIKPWISSKIAWQRIFQRLVMQEISETKRLTRSRPNRRYGLNSPAKKRENELVLSFIVDTSGSISSEDYSKIVTELIKIQQYVKEFHIIYADSEVKHIERFTGKKDFKPVGGGGTAYQPALDKAKELKSNLIIYAGDMQCNDSGELINPKIPVIWLDIEGYMSPASFGKYLVIKE